MGSRRARGPSIIPNETNTLGWSLHLCRQKCIEEFQERIEQDYTWIQEVLVEIKKKFDSPEVTLCPKTPSASRTRSARSKRDNQTNNEEITESKKPVKKGRKGRNASKRNDTASELDASTESQEDAETSARSTRSTRSTRAAAAASSSQTRGGRSTRGRNAKDNKEGVPSGPEPVFSIVPKEVSFDKNVRTSMKSDQEVQSEEDESEDGNVANESSVIIIETESESDECQPPSKRSKTPNNSFRKEDKTPSPRARSKSESSQKRKRTPETPVESDEDVIAKTPETVVKPILKKKSPVKVFRTKTNSPVKKSSRNTIPDITSPRTIPNFAVLNVKGKAQAYEDYVNKSFGETSIEKVASPKPKKLSNKQLHELKTSTPNSAVRQNDRTALVNKNSPFTTLKTKRTAQQKPPNRRSSTKVTSVKGGVRLSLSKRRSSIMRHKMRNDSFKQQALTKQVKEKVNESLRSSPEKSPSQERPQRAARSKLRLNKGKPPQISAGYSSSDEPRSPAQPVRSTRSKMRANKPVPMLPVEEYSGGSDTPPSDVDMDEVDNPKTPVPVQRTTRSKLRQNQPAPPSLPTPPSDEDGSSTPVASPDERSYRRSGHNGSIKRSRMVNDDSDETSPPKRQCVEDTNATPSKSRGPRIIKPIRGGPVCTGSSGKRPANLNTTATSFIQRNTPKKKTNREALEQKRKLLEAKEKEAENRLQKREELLRKNREDMRRLREERQKAVAQRREEREKKEKEMKLGIVKKLENTKDMTSKIFEEKLKEEREKQKQREKKTVEAELRRKQEEDARILKLKEQEQEQKRIDEMQQRKREFEEKERMRKIAEQRKLEEERRKEQERERQREEEKQRAIEEENRRKEEALRREREERERKERLERERIEREKQEERERIRRQELERQKEAERQKLLEMKAKQQEKEKKERAENQEVLAMIQKHNHTLQQNSSLNVSKNTSLNTSGSAKPMGQKLNTSYTVAKYAVSEKPIREEPENPDSYEITPVKVKTICKKANEENYNIDDLKSDDSTDDEDRPRKRIPPWASGGQLKAALINQYYTPPNLDEIFDEIISPDLNLLFAKKRPRFNKRTSSAMWDSPILKPSGALPS